MSSCLGSVTLSEGKNNCSKICSIQATTIELPASLYCWDSEMYIGFPFFLWPLT